MDVDFSQMRYLVAIFLFLIFSSPVSAADITGNVMHSGVFSPGARSSASANGSLDSVIGEHPQKIKTTIQSHGHFYYITSNGNVINTEGDVLLSGKTETHNTDTDTHAKNRSAVAKKELLEPVFIGVMNRNLITRRHLHFSGKGNDLQPPARSSPGLEGVFIAPLHTLSEGDQTTLVKNTADNLARHDGNLYSMAGNHSECHSARYAQALPDNSAVLLIDLSGEKKSINH